MSFTRTSLVAACMVLTSLSACKSDDPKSSGTAGTGSSAGTGSAGTTAGTSSTAGTSATAGTGSSAGTGAAGSGGTAGSAGSGSAGTSAKDAGGDDDGSAGTGGAGTFTVESADVADGAMLPAKFRCVKLMGDTGPSPELHYQGAPAETKSYAVMLTDKTYMEYAHWTIYDIPTTVTELPQGVPTGAMPSMPAGAKQAKNSPYLTGPGYFGPCGMSGVNNYEFTVHAMDVATLPGVDANTATADVRKAIMMHTIKSAKLAIKSGP